MVPLQLGHKFKRKNLLSLRRLLEGFPYFFKENIQKTEKLTFVLRRSASISLWVIPSRESDKD